MLELKKKRNLNIFLILVILTIILTLISNKFLNFQELTYSFYAEQLSQKQIEKLLKNQQNWNWVIYLIIPLLIFLRANLVAFCLSIGIFFYDLENKVKFNQLLKITLIGEYIILSVGYFKFIFFYFIVRKFTLQEFQQFYPLSYTNLLSLEKIEPWLVYPLQTINLFEIGYFFVLVYGLHKLLKNKFLKSFEIVAVSYGTGLLIWIVAIMFLTLNIS
ncbi:hypothetical protein [Polaribacter sp. HaHaR_3_91]|uniref:hypothetical protein n=1 Tax=Polaribacter sp. HaHaR_3_91 TaxID=2745561 RepID=UPI001C4F5518|nr:hypothetical protein [Polaribacter sp. HaHaR_3_91]QXP63262.1 hypothetical protein H0I27_15645 [Polaribacter sp. HaHaR_3_91]